MLVKGGERLVAEVLSNSKQVYFLFLKVFARENVFKVVKLVVSTRGQIMPKEIYTGLG